MVQIDNKQKEIKITFLGDVSDLTGMQTALMELMQHYNYKDFGSGASEMFYYALNLLQALTPDTEQQEIGLIKTYRRCQFPENLTEKQWYSLNEALTMIEKHETTKQKNPVFEALNGLER